MLSERLSRVGGLWRGLHDGSESDLAGGSEDKEAGTPHQPLLELSSAPANLAALGSSGQHRSSSSGDPLLLPPQDPPLHQLSAPLPKPTRPSRQQPKPTSPNARGLPSVVPECLLSGYFCCEGKQRPEIQYLIFVWGENCQLWSPRGQGGRRGPREALRRYWVRSPATRWTQAFCCLEHDGDLP